MEKNYELTETFKELLDGIKLFQIKCIKDFQYAKKGDLGGWIEHEKNLSGNAQIYGDADYCCFQSFGSVNRTTTVFKEANGKIKIICGCFNGTIDEFKNQVLQTHKENKFAKEYLAIIEVIKIKFEI